MIEEPVQLLHVATGTAPDRDPPAHADRRRRDQPVDRGRDLRRSGRRGATSPVRSPRSWLAEAPWSITTRCRRSRSRRFIWPTRQFHQDRASDLTRTPSHRRRPGAGNDLNVVLDGEGVECTLNGLYVLRGTQFLDNHMRVDHAKPHCNSATSCSRASSTTRAARCSTAASSSAKDAQKTDAKQTSMNLLLSNEALVNTKPQLEIFADDVKCTHGATIGQLDDDAIFYLRSRGIGEDAARQPADLRLRQRHRGADQGAGGAARADGVPVRPAAEG